MKSSILFLILVLSVVACGGQPNPAIATSVSTPTPLPTSTTSKTECYTPSQPFGEKGLSISQWKVWDGSQRDYTNSLGSTFSLRVEDKELIAWLDPLNPDVKAGEIGRFPLEPETYVAIPMATDIESSPNHLTMLIAGPIMISICSNGQIWLSDEWSNNEVILDIFDLRDGLYPPQWFGDSA